MADYRGYKVRLMPVGARGVLSAGRCFGRSRFSVGRRSLVHPGQYLVIRVNAVGFLDVGTQYAIAELGVFPLSLPVFRIDECEVYHQGIAVIDYAVALYNRQLIAGDYARLD